MRPARAEASVGEWRAGWRLVLASMAGMSVGSIHVHSMGAFIQPLQQEFGWTRGQIAGSLTIVSVVCMLLAPFVGAVIDRYGSRWVGICGVVLLCGSLAGLSLSGPNIASWWMLWGLVSIGVLLTSPITWSAAISGAFERRRGIALALMLCGTGLSSAILPSLATRLIDSEGWRDAYINLAALWAAITLPLLLFFFFDRRPRESQPPASKQSVPKLIPGIGLREAVRSGRFIKLCLTGLVLSMALIGTSVNLIPILGDRGLSRGAAAAIAGITGPAAILGRLTTGFLLDKASSPLIGATAVLVPILSYLLLLFAPLTTPVAIWAAALLGLGIGAELDIIAFLTARYFGLRHYGRLYGIVVAFLGFATGLGPFLAATIYDTNGSYDLWLAMAIPALLLASLLLATLGKYPD